MLRCLICIAIFLLINAKIYDYFNLSVPEIDDLGFTFYGWALLMSFSTECSLRGYVFEKLRFKQKMSFVRAALITTILYVIYGCVSNRPYSFIDGINWFLIWNITSYTIFSLLMCWLYMYQRNVLILTCISLVYCVTSTIYVW